MIACLAWWITVPLVLMGPSVAVVGFAMLTSNSRTGEGQPMKARGH